ncbi:MAG: three-Cys-motif partner protein TcmP [Anaerolineae bacterium]|nr:three-Cys-motif partner protein TcmP [Anaerolineae bacterium]
MPSKDTHDKYWDDYDGLQAAKHAMLGNYLDGWYPILSKVSGGILYVDCHAGRGRHETGDEGSPILALNRLLAHKSRKQILEHSCPYFVFFEKEKSNFDALQAELQKLGDPPGIQIRPFQEDFQLKLEDVIEEISAECAGSISIFAFIDPFGFTLSMSFLNRLLSQHRSELLINLMYTGIDKEIHNTLSQPSPTKIELLDNLFGSDGWRQMTKEIYPEPQKRAEETILLFSRQLEAQYVTQMYMRSHNKLKYALLHATNHKRGRELMIDTLWKVTPDGSFTAVEKNRPEQLVLITPEPNFEPLKEALWKEYAGREALAKDIFDWRLQTLYRKTHLRKILKEYHDHQIIEFVGTTALKDSTLIRFPPERREPYTQLNLI